MQHRLGDRVQDAARLPVLQYVNVLGRSRATAALAQSAATDIWTAPHTSPRRPQHGRLLRPWGNNYLGTTISGVTSSPPLKAF